MMKNEEVAFLNQLIKTLEESALELEKAYKQKDYDKFNKMKILIAQIQKKISGDIE